MNDEHPQLSRYLDGESPASDLPPEVVGQAERWHRLLGHLGDDAVPSPIGLDAEIMAAVRRSPPPRRRTLASWFTRPVSLRLTRLGWMATAAALVGIASLPWLLREDLATEAAAPEPRFTSFSLLAPEARSVAVTGDFVAWDEQGIGLVADSAGTWSVNLPLEPGVYRYVFIVNGTEWRPDPEGISVGSDFAATASTRIVTATSDL